MSKNRKNLEQKMKEAELSRIEKVVIRFRGINGEKESIDEVAKKLGLTRKIVLEIEKGALAKLQQNGKI